ncbi:succinate dehydrogenase, hydrophobic membrane anchor protein [Agaricicola taiwanensis]|uniref:Succinate dehydrogenase hydrophobic membrane anchor subunit n=1 Tax=Agaricicola taiwanensis TaxID=591372 RepID=A0A8J2VJH1_9RHOB|nr:succinate dehydrogenase, hydrophobic membrane anchor protein [Agaricicola taiwanensis]GGE27263.1 succinate dehydrogenase, hydrophobic membrane anchor protein [Agaricicola taiwanensis]
MPEMRTPLSKVRGLGSAKSGAKTWWRERVGAAALLPLTLFFIWLVLSLAGSDHAAAVATIGNPFVMVLLLLFILVSADHMKLGMQVIIEDYVHSEGQKVVWLVLNTFFSYGLAAAGVVAVLKIGFGM